MEYKHIIKIENPYGQITISANSQQHLEKLIKQYGIKFTIDAFDDLDRAFVKFKSKYPPNNKMNKQSAIWKAGLEKQVLELYLQGLEIDQALDHIQNNFNLKTSRTALARYWTKFRKCGILPTVFLKKEIANAG